MSVGTILLKAIVARELLKHGPMDMQEFNNTIKETIHMLRLNGYDINDDAIIQVINLFSVKNGKVVLSDEGLRYLETLNLIPNQLTQLLGNLLNG